jgi:ankyrin repeat protein
MLGLPARRITSWSVAAVTVAALVAAVSIATPAKPTLLDAAEAGDRAAALKLLAERADPNTLGPDGTTATMFAAHNDDLALVQALIKAGANVKLKNQFGTSAITEAAIIGSAPIIDALIKAGADPNFKNPDGETPLMEAARSGRIDAAKRLLDAGADVNAKENWGGQSAVMWAASQSQADMIKLLASRGADVNAIGKVNQWERKVLGEPRPKDMNKGGFTPLLYAAREGCIECAKNLIAAKADPDLQDPDGLTALNMALLNMHFNFAAYMIQAGADLDRWDLWGRSPIYMAADVSTLPMKGNGAVAVIPSEDSMTAVEVAKLMLEAGANPNIQLKRRPPYRDVPQDRGGDGLLAQGATALMRAARGGDAPFVELLLKHKALVDLPNKDGVTPLMAAAGVDYATRLTRGRNRTDEGVIASMKLLLAAGADINARNLTEPRGGGAGAGGRGGGGGRGQAAPANAPPAGAPPVGAAAGAGGGGGVRRGSQMPSANVVPHQTALHGAASHGFDPLVEFLANNGADLQAKDADGRTPLDLARGGGGGRGGAPAVEAFPKTVALLQSLIAAKGGAPALPK